MEKNTIKKVMQLIKDVAENPQIPAEDIERHVLQIFAEHDSLAGKERMSCWKCGIWLDQKHFDECKTKGHYVSIERLVPAQWISIAVYNIPVESEIQ